MATETFQEYRIAILGDLQRLGDSLAKLQEVVMALTIEVGQLKTTEKVRSGIWGGVGGIITTVLITLLLERMLR